MIACRIGACGRKGTWIFGREDMYSATTELSDAYGPVMASCFHGASMRRWMNCTRQWDSGGCSIYPLPFAETRGPRMLF